METVVNFLFVTFFILLAVIAYRALLRRFQRGQVQHKEYCELYTIDHQNARGELAFYFVCPRQMQVQFCIWQNNQLVKELANKEFEKGGNIIRFDSATLPNGVYYYGIITPEQETKKRMTLAN